MPDIFPGAKHMQLVQWGFPMGSLRPVPPRDRAWSVIHITANLATAEAEWTWRSDGNPARNSATFFVNRNGAPVQMLGDPLRMDPWANGDVNTPDVSNPRIAQMVRDGVNANERTLVAIENVGNEFAWGSVPGGHPITPDQEETCARIIAYYHPKAGVPISRETVIGHYQLNRVNRPNCPSANKSILDRIVARAQAIANGEMVYDVPTPLRFQAIPWDTKANAPFWTGGPGTGERKQFVGVVRVDSIARSTDLKWVLIRVPVTDGRDEYVWVERQHLTPTVAGGDTKYEAAVRKVISEGPAALQPADPELQRKLDAALQTVAEQKATITEQGARITAAKAALG